MPDPRWDQLAEILINHSTRLAAGESLLIECFDLDDSTLPRLLVQKAARKGAFPLVETKDTRILRELIRNGSEGQMRLFGEYERYRMERVDAYIALRGARNINEMSDVPGEKMNLYNTLFMKPVHFDCRIKTTKWCVLRLPNASMAQQAGMSTEAFENFYFDVCNLDYPRLARALQPAGPPDGGGARGPHHGAGDRPAVLDRGHPGRRLRGRDEHPRRRGLHRPGARLGRGARPVQHADGLPGQLVRRRPARIRDGPDRRGRLHRGRRQEAPAGLRDRRGGVATSASGRSAATRGS